MEYFIINNSVLNEQGPDWSRYINPLDKPLQKKKYNFKHNNYEKIRQVSRIMG